MGKGYAEGPAAEERFAELERAERAARDEVPERAAVFGATSENPETHFLGWLGEPGRGMALSTGEVKFKGMVRPDTKLLEYGIDFKRVMRGRLVLGTADGWLKADGETIYQATDLRVGLSKDKAA